MAGTTEFAYPTPSYYKVLLYTENGPVKNRPEITCVLTKLETEI